MRHFILPIFFFVHPKDTFSVPEPTAVVNRKRLMRKGLRQYEGAVGMLGGKAEPDEDRLACLARELEEEVGLDLGCVDESWVIEGEGFTVTWFLIDGNGEAFVRQLAGQCEEGVIDVLLQSEVEKDRYADFKVKELILQALAAADKRRLSA
jgi:8-oxo-dGTP pyrophosphatase MutT (NUDIX family)